MALLGSVAAQRFPSIHSASRKAPVVTTLTPVRYRLQQTAPADPPTASVVVTVDAQETTAPDLPALADALHGIAVVPDTLPKTTNGENSNALPAWFGWAHLDGKRARVQINAPAIIGAEGLGVYAARGEWGTSLCLVNKTNARLLTTAQLRLSRGVYTIERLTLGEGTEEKEKRRRGEEETPSGVASTLNSQPSALNHLEGCDFGGTGTVRKAFLLEPGQACLYRCVDSAREARAAWYDVFTQLREMGTHQPGPAHRLSVMLHEADSYLSGVSGGGNHRGRDARLECIHHLLLVTAQAHSLHHNYQLRHTVEEKTGKDVFAAMDHLTTALSDTSAVLLGLVPQVSVTPTPGWSAQARTAALVREQTDPSDTNKSGANKKENNASAPNIPARTERAVVVSLENTGGRSVTNVKLGLNMNAMPGGVTCEPADPAYFDSLRPGQSVRAIFHVRSAGGADLPPALFTGDVSYFAGTAPAHLRLRAW